MSKSCLYQTSNVVPKVPFAVTSHICISPTLLSSYIRDRSQTTGGGGLMQKEVLKFLTGSSVGLAETNFAWQEGPQKYFRSKEEGREN